MEHLDAARATREQIVALGGAFMIAPQMAAEEARLGLPDRSLYFRGRSAVLGDPPSRVVSALFGIFPDWLLELMLEKATPAVSAQEAIDGYTRACAAWGAEVFGAGHVTGDGNGGAAAEAAEAAEMAEAAELLERVVDAADGSALPLFAGWQQQTRPQAPAERLAFALMLARELRGGLHFAALRACGLSVPEAVVVDPRGGRARMLRTAWREEDADALIAAVRERADVEERWQRAERMTDEAFAVSLSVLDDAETQRLVHLLDRYVHRAG